MNLVSMAMNFITPAILGRVASALGVDSKIAQMAISAALPAILGSVIGKSSSPSGLSQLTNVLGQQDAGMLSNLAGMIGGADQSKLVNSGSNMLGSLLGTSALGSVAGAIGKFSGLGDGPAKTLLGMMAPVALGTVAQQQKAGGLDAAGLAKMLAGQKDNVMAAMPAGFSGLLKGTGLLDAVMGAAPAAAAATSTTASRPASTAAPVTHAPAPTGLPSWLTWGALLAALIAGWYLLGPGSGRRIAAPPTSIMHNNQNVAAQVNGLYDNLKTTLGNIKDAGSAQAALPRLQDSVKQLDGLQALAGGMPAATKSDLALLVASYLPQVRALVQTVLNTAGVGAIAKPVLDQLLSRMEALSK